jgi:serine/threonine protein kinase
MGKVSKAHDTVIDRDVAIKVFRTELGTEPGYRQRFRSEAETADRSAEPHIIALSDTGDIDGQLSLAMPIIDGVDMPGLLQRDGPMNPRAPCTSSSSSLARWMSRSRKDLPRIR